MADVQSYHPATKEEIAAMQAAEREVERVCRRARASRKLSDKRGLFFYDGPRKRFVFVRADP